MLPNFLVIGAAKAATTSVCYHLGQHPDVYVSKPKETNFFAYDHVYRKGIGWYQSFFESAGAAQAVGEGSPPYTYRSVYPFAAERVAQHLPNARLIYIVRHPIERARSHWLQIVSNGHATPLPLRQAFEQIPDCIDASLYWTQINAYRQYFPDDRILIQYFDDYKANPEQVIRNCVEFLGVNPDFTPADTDRPINATADSFEDRPLMQRLRHVPGLVHVGMRLPKPIRRMARAVLRRPMDGAHAPWDAETWQWVREQVEDDVQQFLKFYGKPADYWNLDVPETLRQV